MPHAHREFKLAILRALAEREDHKNNIVGDEGGTGRVEAKLGRGLTPDERGLVGRVFDTLFAEGYIRPTGRQMATSDRDKWVTLTDLGRAAIARGELDDLDVALARLAPRFVEMRAGAWERIASDAPDAVRQAAHSGRELINQVVEFVPDKSHREQLRELLRQTHGEVQGRTVELAEQWIKHALAALNSLTPESHKHGDPSRSIVESGLAAMDTTLRLILVRYSL